jgi:galactokinase
VQSFREIKSAADVELHKDKMKPEVYHCCKFVVEEIARTQKAAALLQQNDVTAFGQLMYAGHEGLSKLYEVSCPESDFLVAFAKASGKVIGARQMGGGFGGCTINIIKNEAIDAFIATATIAYKKEFDIELEAYVMEISDGVEKIELKIS